MAVQRNISIEQDAWKRLKAEASKRNKNARELAGEIISGFLGKGKGDSGTKAIILAAGMSKRMMQLTKDRPKCMLKLGGKTVLQRQIETLRKCGIKDIVVVRGYKKRKINYPGIRYINNPNYSKGNILESLMAAESEMDQEFIATYSDTLFEKNVVKKLLQCRGDICIVADSDWKKAYDGRYQHPKEEAEKVLLGKGRVVRIAKEIPAVEANAEFIGMVKLSKKGAGILKQNYRRLKKELAGRPFHSAASLEKAYMTDMLQELIDRGHEVTPVEIKGSWMELDTLEDFQRAKKTKRGGFP